jgi:hypothetical protein
MVSRRQRQAAYSYSKVDAALENGLFMDEVIDPYEVIPLHLLSFAPPECGQEVCNCDNFEFTHHCAECHDPMEWLAA